MQSWASASLPSVSVLLVMTFRPKAKLGVRHAHDISMAFGLQLAGKQLLAHPVCFLRAECSQSKNTSRSQTGGSSNSFHVQAPQCKHQAGPLDAVNFSTCHSPSPIGTISPTASCISASPRATTIPNARIQKHTGFSTAFQLIPPDCGPSADKSHDHMPLTSDRPARSIGTSSAGSSDARQRTLPARQWCGVISPHGSTRSVASKRIQFTSSIPT